MKLHELLKIQIRRHTASFYQIRAANARNSSRKNSALSGNLPSPGTSYEWLGRCRPPPEFTKHFASGSGGSHSNQPERRENQSAMEFSSVVHSKGFHAVGDATPASPRALSAGAAATIDFCANWPLAWIEEMANPKP
jgi:hypothetical protein